MVSKHNVRVRNGFSDRNSIKPISKIMQVDSLTDDTRIVLFNTLSNVLNHQIKNIGYDEDILCKIMTEELFNEVYYDRYHNNFDSLMADILEMFKTESYDVILTMIEFICSMVYETYEDYSNRTHYCLLNNYYDTFKVMNVAFEDEYIGYRFVEDRIVKITNDEEIKAIEESNSTPFDEVNKSISKSISFLSESSNKDYKNAIKEAIIAVEQLFNIILETNGLTLTNALGQICDKIHIDINLKESIKNLYKYTNEVNGIRHGNNKNSDEISFDEAKYVLLICSATINYFSTLIIN